MAKKVILSGMQPTGRLHLGNLEGALANWVALQNDYDMYCCIVDWHSLTERYKDLASLDDDIVQMAIDYLAAGLDPHKVAIFIQSQVKEHAELHLLLSMITPTPWLERVPSYKEKSEKLGLDSYGFLGYGLLQAADILVYRADFVPVGKDQLPHIELSREIVRRFNGLYGEVFPEPQAKLTKVPEVPGIDGGKMSKSYNNQIAIADTPEVTTEKLKKMFTDPLKLRKGDPGRPEICPVFTLHKIYTTHEQLAEIDRACRSGELGCVADKKHLAESINKALEPIRQKRRELEANPGYVNEVLAEGAKRARARARDDGNGEREDASAMTEEQIYDDVEVGAESFPIKIEGFEGPLDLLLYLIRNQEIDIYDIPIAKITGQYLEYIKAMKLLNLEIAGEYLLMAATLIRIKARLLMPRHPEIDGEDEDPREELIVALLEYKRFREAAEKMTIMEVKERQILKRGDFSYLSKEVQETFTMEATLYDLVSVFNEVMKSAAPEPMHEVRNYELSIEDQVEYILKLLEDVDQITLTKLLLSDPSRFYCVVTFVALLELVKLQRVSARQHRHFGEIYVVRL